MKRKLQKILRSFGYDVRQTGRGLGFVSLQDFLESRRIELVLDVGANAGQFAKGLRADGYRGRIVSFEPVREVFQRLLEDVNRDPRWEAHNFALGANEGRATINVSSNSVLSSFVKQTDLAGSFDKGAEIAYEEEVSVVRLDNFLENVDVPTFLKIDTQGFEKQVLEGAAESLRKIEGVQLELPIVHLYRGTWHFEEAVSFMKGIGFVISQIHTVNYQFSDPASLLEVDCVFRRVGSDDA